MDTTQRGFTLVELMVAILILLIGVTSILAILPLAFNIQQNSKDVIMSEIVARNASAMLSARKIKYSDLRQSMVSVDFDHFKPMNPADYPGATDFRTDGIDSASKSGNALLYADTGRMAFPLPNGRVNIYGDLKSQMDAARIPAARKILRDALLNTSGQKLAFARAGIESELATALGVSTGFTWSDTYMMVRGICISYNTSSSGVRFRNSIIIDGPTNGDQLNVDEAVAAAEAEFSYGNILPEIRYTTGGKNDFDERSQGYGLTSLKHQARDRSRHLWGYNFSQNMMATHTGTDKAPAHLWTIKDRSFPSLSRRKISDRDYFWVPLLYDADPRPGRFEWRAYVVVTVRFPGRNYKYQGQVHTDHGTSVQAFAANPRDPDTVPRVTAIPMDMANATVNGDAVQRYDGNSYKALNWVYYPKWPDTSSTATIQATVSRGKMSEQDKYLTTPNNKAYHHGQVSGRFIPGDKFEVTVGQPYINYLRDFQTTGWMLAGATPTQILKAGQFNSGSGLRHPIPFNDVHYNPRNSSFKMWCWMSHNNGIGRVSVGRIMPVSGQVVDMSN